VSAADGPVIMEVALPSALRAAATVRAYVDGSAVASTVQGGLARFTLPARRDARVEWRIGS